MSGGDSEFGLIGELRRRVAAHPVIALGIGDDGAVLRPIDGSIVVAADMLLDGRHFRLDECGPEAVGRKALGVNLSDLAAMAARPIAAFASVALPKKRGAEVFRGLADGMIPMAERFGIALAGGDTNAWDGPLVVDLAVIGATTEHGPATRSAARVGDVIVVTGPLGGSALGRHLDPRPRVEEALTLRRLAPRLALIDLSDGLASDLGHVLEGSGGLGATLDAEAVPFHPDAVRLAARDGRPTLEHALGDGEDFELCACLDPEVLRRVRAGAPALTLVEVGRVEAEPGLRLRDGDGAPRPLSGFGFDHLRSG